MMASGTTGTKLICVAVCLGLWCTTRQVASSLSGTSAIVVNENGYDNVAVAIKPGVTPNNELIEKIKVSYILVGSNFISLKKTLGRLYC